VDLSKPWEFFDGASKNNNLSCGGGDILHLSPDNSFKLKMGMGSETNNFTELMALKLLLLFAREKEVKSLQIVGDSMLVIN
jgi:ribonuclease HI